MKRINLPESITIAVAAFAVIFTISAFMHIYLLTEAGLIDWRY